MTVTRNFIDDGNILAAATYLGVFEAEARGKGCIKRTDGRNFINLAKII